MNSGKKENGDLGPIYERNSKWAERLASLIIVGLAVEIAAVFMLHKPPLEAVLSIASTVLIIAGVWGELIFERCAKEAADGIVAQAKERVAESELRIAKLNKEAAELRKSASARHVDFQKFAKALEGEPKLPVEIWYSNAASDASMLATEINWALERAGWEFRRAIPIPHAEPIASDRDPRWLLSDISAAGGSSSGISVARHGPVSTKDISPQMALLHAIAEGIGRTAHATGVETVPEGTLRIIIAPKADLDGW